MRKIVLLVVTLVISLSSFAKEQKKVDGKGVKSFLNQKAPTLVVEKWLTEEPDTTGKFILLELYGLFCPPCWEAVPKLNKFHKEFKNKMTIIGLTRQEGKLPQEPHADYYKAIDTKGRTYNEIGLNFVPYAMIIDRGGIVRWEGSPNDLTEDIIKKILKKYK